MEFLGRIAVGEFDGLISGDNDAVCIQQKHFIAGVVEKHAVCFQRQLCFFASGDILLNRYEMRNGGVSVPNGGDGHFFVI